MKINHNSIENSYIKTLDGFRAIAILMVMFSHMLTIPKIQNFFPISEFGGKGVSIFFVISGFIITLHLINDLNTKGISLKDFYLKRFFRLMPSSLLYLIFLICLSLMGWIKISQLEIFASIFSFRNYIPSVEWDRTAFFWSLSIEEHFYLLLPSFIIFFKKNRRYIMGLFIACILVAIWRKLLSNNFLNLSYSDWYTFCRIDGLIYGSILSYFYYFHRNKILLLKKYFINYIFLILLLLLWWHPIPFYKSLESIFIALIILSTILHEKNILHIILETKFFKFFGKISYSLYLWNVLFIYNMPMAPDWIQLITGKWYSVFFAIALSYLNFKFIENPFRKLYKNLTNMENSSIRIK